MRSNTKLNYKQKTEEITYRAQPPGKLSVERLIQGQDAWHSETLDETFIQKTIIISDCLQIEQLNEEEKEKLKDYLTSLKQQGFKIYGSNGKTLTEITNEQLDKLDLSIFVKPMDIEKNVISDKTAQALGIPAEQLIVLDYYDLQNVMKGDYSDEAPKILKSHLYGESFFNLLEKDNYPTEVEVNIFDFEQILRAKHLNDKLYIKETYRFDTLILDKNNKSRKIIVNDHGEITVAVEQRMEGYEPFSMELTPKDMENITTIRYEEGQIEFEQFKKILKQCPNLTSLEKIEVEFPEVDNVYDMSQVLACIPQLKSIKGQFTGQQIKEISAAKLNYLEDISITPIGRFEWNEFKAQYLRNINIDCTRLGIQATIINLEELLNNGANLESLYLKNGSSEKKQRIFIRNDDAIYDANHNRSFKKLRKLILDNYSIEINTLQEILSKATNLKEIVLRDFDKRSPSDEEKGNYLFNELPALTNLTVSLHLSPPKVAEWLLHQPNIESLEIDNDLDGKFAKLITSKNPPVFRCLKKVKLDECKLGDTLQNFFDLAPNLQEIEFESCPKLNFDLIKPESVKNIREITIKNCGKLKTADFEKITKIFPNLKKLLVFDSSKLSNEDQDKFNQHLSRKNENIEITFGNIYSHTYDADYSDESESEVFLSDVDASFSSDFFMNYKPSEEFTYKGKTGFDQGMIVEKLSIYLQKSGKYDYIIPKIQGGICEVLSAVFQQKNLEEWKKFIEAVSTWDVKEKINNYLQDEFENLINIYLYTDKMSHPKCYLIGDNLADFFSKNKKDFIMGNNWHSISVKYIPDENEWVLYDPNFSKGYKTFHHQDDLAKAVHLSIGEACYVYLNEPHLPQIKIDKPNDFIAIGGLFSLNVISNTHAVLDILEKAEITKDAFDGLLLRNLKAQPCWLTAAAYTDIRAKNFINKLLIKFIQEDENAIKKLIASVKDVSNFERHVALEILNQLANALNINDEQLESELKVLRSTAMPAAAIPGSPPVKFEISLEINQMFEVERFRKRFRQSEKTVSETTILEYVQELIANPNRKKRTLIKVNAKDDASTFNLNIEKYCEKIKRPCFYIDSPVQLALQSPFIYRNKDNKGEMKEGPTGPLYDFLEAHKNDIEPPILLINYDHFTSEDIVRLNSVIDKNRKIDGIDLPTNIDIIGVIDQNKPNVYKDGDFYSRFDQVKVCPFSTDNLKAPLVPSITVKHEEDEREKFVIDLYESSDWKTILLGHWMIKKDKLTFDAGSLSKAIESGLPIEIRNAPWKDARFNDFWNRMVTKGYVEEAEKRIKFPSNVEIYHSEGLDWESLLKNVDVSSGLIESEEAITVNPTSFYKLFSRYNIDNNDASIEMLDGHIKACKDSYIHFNVTRDLNKMQWARVFAECKKHRVKPYVHSVPKEQKNEEQNPHILETNDVHFTTQQLQNEHPEKKWLVIDVSELNASDLIKSIHANFKKDEKRFEFISRDGALVKALKEGKSVILKGDFSNEVNDALAEMGLSDQVWCVTKNDEKRVVSASDKKNALEKSYAKESIDKIAEDIFEKETSNQIKARLDYLTLNPNGHSNDAWIGMTSLPPKNALLPIDFNTADALSMQFENERKKQLDDALNVSPSIVVTGLSGVAKTTFVEEYANGDDRQLFRGEEQLVTWATAESEKKKTLVIDEANIGKMDWLNFEGLHDDPKGMMIGGTYYPLKGRCEVIFLVNPAAYSYDRHFPQYFKEHGHAVLFQPLPLAYIYEKTLKPILGNDKNSETIAKEILNVYEFICHRSKEEILISPRELQMIALLTKNFLKKHPNYDAGNVTKNYIYDIAHTLINDSMRNEFNAKFKPDDDLPPSAILQSSDEYVLTESRKKISELISDFIQLRDFRRSDDADNDIKKFGGLGGMVLEGEPGNGKSELVIQSLLEHGYANGESKHVDPNHQKLFYSLPVGMEMTKKKELLLKAFHQGGVVIVDEINSSPMLERLMNDLLMGKAPDGSRPEKPGFMLIGTQNPISMAGRREMSIAMKRRLLSYSLPAYTNGEMLQILMAKGLDKENATNLIQAYEIERRAAIKNNSRPIPCFRDVLRIAEQEILARMRVLQKNENDLNEKPLSPRILAPASKLFRPDMHKETNPYQKAPEKDKSLYKK